jgi:hypothetical protein
MTMSMREFQRNELAGDFGMRELTPGEWGCFAGAVGDARITEVLLYGRIDAELILDDESLELHWIYPEGPMSAPDPGDRTRCYQWDSENRLERELMAALVITKSTEPTLGLTQEGLIELGWERII